MNDMADTSKDSNPLMLEPSVGTSVAEKAGKVSKCEKSRVRGEQCLPAISPQLPLLASCG